MNWLHAALSDRKAAGALVVVGIVIRLLLVLLIAHHPLMSDSASYNRMATQLLEGKPFVPFWPPGVPLYVALVHYLFGESDLVVRLGMLVFYVGCSFFLYRTALFLTGETVAGNLSLLLLALSPATILASVESATELPAAMLLIIIAYCVLRVESKMRFGNLLLLGTAIGCLALVRPSSLILLLLAPPYLAWRTRKLAGAGTVLLVGTLIVGTWIGYVHQKTGHFVKINTGNSKNLFYGNNPDTPLYRTWWWAGHHERENAFLTRVQASTSDPIAQEAEFSRIARQYIRQHPGLFLIRSFNRVCTYFAFNTFAGSYLMMSYRLPKVVGFAVLGWDASLYLLVAAASTVYAVAVFGLNQRALNSCILLGLALLYAFPYFLAFSHPRYHYPIEPILMALGAAFFASVIKHDMPWETIKRRQAVLTALLLAFGLIQVEFFIMMADRI